MRTSVPALMLLLAACGDASRDEQEQEGAFDDLTGTLERAEEVEQKVLEQKQRLDEALEQAEDDPGRRSPQR